MLKNSTQNCIGAPSSPLGSGTPCYCPAESLRLRFAKIRFTPGFHRSGNGILLADRNFLAALDQFIGAFAEFAGFLLREVLAFVRLLRKEIARIFAGLGSKENANQSSDAQPYEEISHLGTNIIRHDNLHRNRSIANITAQCRLTAMWPPNWLLCCRAPKMRQDLLCTFTRDNTAQFLQSGPLNIGHASKFLQEFLRRLRPHSRDIAQCRFRLPFAAPLAVKRKGKPVRLVANLLDQMEHG